MIEIKGNSAPRTTIGNTLADIYKTNKKVIVIDNDLSTATNSIDFQKQHPENFWGLGIGEQSSISAACGLWVEGFTPVYVNFAIFASGTIWTQLRQAAYAKANLKVIATHPGLDAGLDGASHQAIQDMALMRTLPNMNILLPSDVYDAAAAIKYALSHEGLFYIRVSRDPVPEIYTADDKVVFDITNKELYSTGDDVALFFDGASLEIALKGMEALEKEGIKAHLIHVRSLKPLDTKNLDDMMKKVKCFITLENHSVIGGLGGAIAEYVAGCKNSVPVGIVGARDTFGESAKSTELKEKYGVSAKEVLNQAKRLLSK